MKKRQVVLYFIVMLVLLTTSVYATIQADLNVIITADDNIFYPGEDYIITLGLRNVAVSQGIKTIEGYIDIDENVLEPITIDSILKDENGNVKIGDNNVLSVYDANNIPVEIDDKGIILNTNPISGRGDYRIVINLENEINSNIDLVSIRFVLKDTIPAGKYDSVMSYKLFNVFATDAGEKMELLEKNYSITISERPVDNTPANEPVNNVPTNEPVNNTPVNNAPANKPVNNTPVNNTPTNKPVNNTPVNNAPANKPVNNTPVNNAPANKPVNNTPVNNAPANKPVNNTPANKAPTNKPKQDSGNTGLTKTQGKTDTTKSPTSLPKTGYRVILIPIIAVVIVGLVFYKKYSKYNYHE